MPSSSLYRSRLAEGFSAFMWFACTDGKTKYADGTGLSAKCQAKGCAVCGELEETAPTPAKATTSSPAGEYNREDWPHWIDEDGDCQDTRAEILIRDNVGTIKFKRNKPCNVSWGRWVCPYTGKVLNKASDVDIDHIVPLSHAPGCARRPRKFSAPTFWALYFSSLSKLASR
jgi:hypothetical protein